MTNVCSTRPARTPFWLINAPAWEEVAGGPSATVLLRVDSEEASVLMWALAGVNDPHWFAEEDMGRISLVASGEPQAIIEILSEHAPRLPRPTWALLPSDVPELFDPVLRMWFGTEIGAGWDFYWADEILPGTVEDREVILIEPERARTLIPEFLSIANPTSSSAAHVDDYRWYMLPDEAGDAVCVLGARDTVDLEGREGSYLAGLGTLPQHRGKGYAARLMTEVVRRELDERHLVHFGMWADNRKARALYERLGFTHGGSQIIVSSVPVIEGKHRPVDPE